MRKTAKLQSTHYSTVIEGNKLEREEVEDVIYKSKHFPRRVRDELEVKGYYNSLDYLEKLVKKNRPILENDIKSLHSILMGRKGKTSYREEQNVIKDSTTGKIVYMPPEASDVEKLMKEFVSWINSKKDLPVPIVAAIAHYQFTTIHPYCDGNGRCARLLTSLVLHLYGYDLKGLYSLEEYYAKDLVGYYEALTVGPSHNYYMGRDKADITKWIEYFIHGMSISFKKVKSHAQKEMSVGTSHDEHLMRELDSRQRRVLEFFKDRSLLKASDLVQIFGIRPRTATLWCSKWVDDGFIVIENYSKKARQYRLSEKYIFLI